MTTPLLPSKLPSTGVSIFTVMTRLANEHGAINLSQGFPDFDCAPELVEAVARHMRAGHNQYAPMQGVLALREALATKIERLYGRRYDPATEITVTSGATEGIFSTITAFVRPGDEVILFQPCYDSYAPAVQLNGGTPVFVTLRFPEYRVDWDEVRRALTPRTRLLLINSPHNPTGTALSADDMRELAKVVDGRDVLVVGDEVYEHILFDGRRHESLARYPELSDRSVVISSFGKTYHTTGWKVGYCAAPQPLSAEIQRVHQFVTFAVNAATQHAYAEVVMRDPLAAELAAFYQAKRDLFLRLIEGSRFRPLPCEGTYFQLLDYSAITAERDADVALRLIREHGVAAIPISPFLSGVEPGPVLRFCFAKRDETLERAAERLRRV
ncbi:MULTISPECIES: methionine aminotransferase [Sorangium]|uniref:Aminotransferase n=1 Tax=Sorangium cellulosum TaxID=56 RepID=A0A4P2R7U2_SORCE|nr:MULTISPECIES: methionine aminotransferase [Sorangium]AUX38153.1 aminotransferase [Sorangium cellulosum]WCQ97441.1 Methionine aminotransferase [Sorangium sp. Soce836]